MISTLPHPLIETADTPATHAARVLVADDERRIRLAIRHCLELEGYDVEEAADGREAISAIIHGAPSLLLLDLAMPALDGLSTLRLLSSVYSRVMPRVLVLTAHSSISAAEMSLSLGASGFLEKPFEPDTLLMAVHRALKSPRPVRRTTSDPGNPPLMEPKELPPA